MFDLKKIFSEMVEKVVPIIKKYRADIGNIDKKIKADSTILTIADEEVQNELIKIISRHDSNPSIIAEENGLRFNANKKYTWIIDPIDGTAQFVNPQSREFCTCIAIIEAGFPIASLIILHELGKDCEPIIASAFVNDGIYINGVKCQNGLTHTKKFSATRSKGAEPHSIEQKLLDAGYSLKTRTTSQSIDILRTSVNLSTWSDLDLFTFDGFVRRNQHLWDGIPGMVFCMIVGLNITDGKQSILPYKPSDLDSDDPLNKEILIVSDQLMKELI